MPQTSWLDHAARGMRPDPYVDDPTAWSHDRLGIELWSKQREVAKLLQDNPRVAVQSGHAIGKSKLASVLACHWISTHPPGEAFVVTTAPSAEQVHSILWEYIRAQHRAAGLSGTAQRSDRWLLEDGTLVALGRKPPDYNESAFQGIHRRYVLVLIDEAAGVPAWLWTAAESLATNDDSRILAIGNPDDNASHFAHVCQRDRGWRTVKISAYDSPNLTGEPVSESLRQLLVSRSWVADKLQRWGANSALFKAKVLGEFADSEDGLIPLSWVRAAITRHTAWVESGESERAGPRIIGVDVARYGTDQTAIAVRDADVVRRVSHHAKLDTTETTGLVQAELQHPKSMAVVDVIGVGAGVVDQLRRGRYRVMAFNAAAATRRRDVTGSWRFPNCRSAAWHNVAAALDPANDASLALPDDDDLTADLTTPTSRPATGARLVVEDKEQIRKRLGRSTDVGDAVCAAMWFGLNARDDLDEAGRARKPPRARPYAGAGVNWR